MRNPSSLILYFPSFFLEVDDSVDCAVSYELIGTMPRADIDYVMSRKHSVCRLACSSTLDIKLPTLPPRQQEDEDFIIAEYNEFHRHGYGATTQLDLPSPHPIASRTKRKRHTPFKSPPSSVFCIPLTNGMKLCYVHDKLEDVPPVRPCDLPNGSDDKNSFTPETLHQLFCSRCFKNYGDMA